jgi:hypothetical protein
MWLVCMVAHQASKADPLIKRHAASIDFSSEFFQPNQNPIIPGQRLAAKNPTATDSEWVHMIDWVLNTKTGIMLESV